MSSRHWPHTLPAARPALPTSARLPPNGRSTPLICPPADEHASLVSSNRRRGLLGLGAGARAAFGGGTALLSVALARSRCLLGRSAALRVDRALVDLGRRVTQRIRRCRECLCALATAGSRRLAEATSGDLGQPAVSEHVKPVLLMPLLRHQML